MTNRRAPAIRQNFNFRRTGASSQGFQRNLYRDKFLDIGTYREKCSNSALCNSLIAKIEDSGLKSFTEEYPSKIYPEAVIEFYVNSKGYDDKIKTEVHGVELIITPELLGRLFNLPTTGMRVQDVQVDQEEAYRQWKQKECVDVYKSSTLMSLLQEEYKILASVAARMITGTTESHSEMSEHKYKICAAIIRGIDIN
ncbi:metal ion-binding protein [Perilla frutescens var. hirtella]|nr:metal ion-binding protein [Perilla frutescens var. hirtella]